MSKLMLKLYLDDKHVGYEWHVDGLILHSDIRQPPDLSDKTWFSDITIYESGSWYGCPSGCESSYIQHDSFGIGIEINGKWLFPGDEVVIAGVRFGGISGILNYTESSVTWDVYIADALHPLSDFYNITTKKWLIEKKER